MSFAKLEELGRKLEALEHAQSMLSIDEAVQMPVGGGEKRAEAMAMLAGLHHELATAPEIASISVGLPASTSCSIDDRFAPVSAAIERHCVTASASSIGTPVAVARSPCV